MQLSAPLAFRPVYQNLVWGGRKMLRWRSDLPEGPVGESWDLADHDKGMSVVSGGPLAGETLRALTERFGRELVGAQFRGGTFPLMIKLIDAADRLSVQVHPDDDLARTLGVGNNGKTECWFMLEGGGELFQGTLQGVHRGAFEAALRDGRVSETLNRYEVSEGDFFFLDARTVHALGAGCLLYEIQQTSDVTFRVYDWGRVGLDGKPRPLHVEQSLETIDFDRSGFGPRRPSWVEVRGQGRARELVACPYFKVEERTSSAEPLRGGSTEACSVVICTGGAATLATTGGQLRLEPMTTTLVPAAAGGYTITPEPQVRVLVATPRL